MSKTELAGRLCFISQMKKTHNEVLRPKKLLKMYKIKLIQHQFIKLMRAKPGQRVNTEGNIY